MSGRTSCFFLGILALLCLAATVVLPSPVMAEPAYRTLVTSSPQHDPWLRRDGLTLTLRVDEARCKKEYGKQWFRRCAAAPAGEAGRVVRGVRMNPSVEGTWRWRDDDTMEFTPTAGTLAPGTRYTISLEQVPLPDRFVLNRRVAYTTLPQAVRVDKETFWIDPSPKGAHVLSVPLRFLWPVPAGSMDRRINLVPSDARSGLSFGPTRLVWNERRDEVVLSAPVATLPENTAAAKITIVGLPSFTVEDGACSVDIGANKRPTQDVTAFCSVTGKSRLMDVKNIVIRPSYDGVLNKTYELEITTTLRALPSEVLSRLTLVQLPLTLAAGAGKPADWTKMPAISTQDIQKGTKLQAELLQPADEATDRLRLRLSATAGRGLLTAVDEGLPSISGLRTSRVRRFILQIPSLDKEVDFLQPGHVLTLSGQKKLGVYANGVTSLRWRAERIREPFLALVANEASFEEQDKDMDSLSDAKEGELPVRSTPPGVASFPVLDLGPLLESGTTTTHGLMRITLTGYDGKDEVCQKSRLILVTDMGIIVKNTPEGGRTVFVQHLGKGTPVRGAIVRVLAANGTTVQRAVTDGQGRAELPPGGDFARERRPVAVVAESPADGGADLAWISLDDRQRVVDYSRYAITGRHTSHDGLNASVFSQRGIYLPGDTLYFGCIVRRHDWRPLPQDLPLEAVLISPTGTEVLRQRFSVGADGLQNFSWKSSADAPVGAYQLDIRLAGSRRGASTDATVLGSVRVRVEEFQPDTLALTATFTPTAPKGWIRTGGNAPETGAQVRLDNLYGEAAANHRIHAVLHTEKDRLRFPGYEDYTFCEGAGFDGEDQNLELPDVWTDAQGKARLQLPLGRLPAGTVRGAVLVEGFEPAGGRAVTRRLEALFSPLEVAIGYKPEGKANTLDYVPQNAQASLHVVALNNELTPVALPQVDAIVAARRYVNSLVTDAKGAYHYEATPVDTERTRTRVSFNTMGLSLPLPTEEAGDFLLTLRRADGTLLGTIPFTVAGTRLEQPDGLSSASLAKGDLRLKLDKERYTPGETVKMRLSTPYAGSGLITVERDTVLTHAWFTAQAGECVQEIALPADFQGRGYINVSYARSLDSDEIYMAPYTTAVAAFTVGDTQRDMGLQFHTPARVLPGGVITARLTADVPGRALVFAVDEGVLQLTNFTTPDPLRDLLRDRALDVTTLTAFDLLMPDHARLQGRIPGFGGGMAGPGGRFLNPFKRRGEPPFAFWQAMVPVDAKGTEVRLQVPEYVTGKVRLMAVSAASPQDGNSRVGRAEAYTEIRGTLILKPLLPLAVAPGDVFDGAVVVANTVAGSGKNARVRLTMEPTGDGLTLTQKPSSQTLLVDENGEATVSFRLQAKDALGEYGMRFTAQLETTAKAKPVVRTQTLSVRPAVPRRRTETVHPLTGTTVVETGRHIYPFEAKGQASVAAMPLLALRSLLARLDTYPYGCTEQLVSRALPYAALLDATETQQAVLRSPNEPPARLRERGMTVINAALAAIQERSDYEGVRLWPGMDADEFVTAYAADFLMTLREHTSAIPEGLATTVLDALERMVGRSPAHINDARTKLYGAWVLQRDGRIMTQELERLEQWFKDNTRGWETDVAAAFLADSRRILRLRRKADQTMPKTVNANDDTFLSTGAARALHALMVLQHFPDKAQQLPVAALLDGAFRTTATTVDMALTARTLLEMHAESTASLDQTRLICTKYGQGFTPTTAQPSRQGATLILNAPGCVQFQAVPPADAPELFLLASTEGFDRTPPVEEGSANLTLLRRYTNSRGENVTKAKLGDVLTVELSVQAAQDCQNVVLVDLLPGGVEAILEKDEAEKPQQEGCIRFERREDRAIFFTNLGTDKHVFTYKVRATTRGHFVLPTATAEAMYDPAIHAHTGGGQLTIE